MNATEQVAADTVISRMEFLERIAVLAQGHWNIVEYKVPQDTPDAMNNHQTLGELLKKNREAG